MTEPPACEGPVRRLEFIGDSETAGFGNLGPSEPPGSHSWRHVFHMDPADQDANRAWPALVAEKLGAECHVIAWSGAGVLWNCPDGCSADGNFQALLPRMLGSDASTAATPENGLLQGWEPDAVVVYIGGNDWYSLSEGRHEELGRAFGALLGQLRALRPSAAVLVLLAAPSSFCSCISTLEEQAWFAADMDRCWRRAAELAGHPGVSMHQVEPRPAIDVADRADWGQAAHWSARGHEKWAGAVAPLVSARLGWADGGRAPAQGQLVSLAEQLTSSPARQKRQILARKRELVNSARYQAALRCIAEPLDSQRPRR